MTNQTAFVAITTRIELLLFLVYMKANCIECTLVMYSFIYLFATNDNVQYAAFDTCNDGGNCRNCGVVYYLFNAVR